ncbi:hypothetical protein D9M71_532990 [compost metagenome]
MGIGGIGHAADTGKIDVYARSLSRRTYLSLTLTHRLFAAQTLAVEGFERLASPGHIRQQLHTPPTQVYLNFRLLKAQQLKRTLQMTLANQAPGTDEVEKYVDG